MLQGKERRIGEVGRVLGRWQGWAGESCDQNLLRSLRGAVGAGRLALEEGKEEGRGSFSAGAPLHLRPHCCPTYRGLENVT